MWEPVGLGEKKLDSYRGIVEDALLEDVHRLGRDLRGLRVCHISLTPFGGGISEILFALVPLERDLGMRVDWLTSGGSEDFFRLGKQLHNALQGKTGELAGVERELFERVNRESAREFPADRYDAVIVHSHSLLALPRYLAPGTARWAWRCHLDTSSPDPGVWEFLRPFVETFRGAVFTMEQFVPRDLAGPLVRTIQPAIDPLSPKHRDLPLAECADFVAGLGVDPKLPVLLHVSRLDSWKDPAGLIRSYYRAKEQVPELQFVIISSLALDDQETFATLRSVDAEAAKDEDIHVYTNLDGFGDLEVNAFQRVCRVGIVKPLREGFGLFPSEAMWKRRPVLGNRTGGVALQLADGLSYCLCDGIEEYADKLVRLIRDEACARELGDLGHEHVRTNFLIPRLVRDEAAFLRALADRAG
ncbi:MAG: glycosyltransferase [Chloroflexi bacterium]|nr:glycosyltransferase [Chloroflexota bacterium]